jgi:transcriptional regulator of acetoin/glycerol metabolism
LEHAVEHALIHCGEPIVRLAHLPAEVLQSAPSADVQNSGMKDREQEKILAALEKTDWNKAKAARLLGIDRKTLYRKIEKYQLAG